MMNHPYTFKYFFKAAFLLLILTLLPNQAFAHVGIGEASGWAHGMLHPFLGLDHLCAMLAVGLWAKQLGGRAVWCVPLTFVCVMVLGGLLGIASIPLPFIEAGILLSLLVLGLLIAAAIQLPFFVCVVIVAIFALFHGYAHGVEMPQSMSGLTYALGFMLSTTVLHAIGIAIATGLTKVGRSQWLRLIGGLIAMLGGALYLVG
jgi:urease accessory protein